MKKLIVIPLLFFSLILSATKYYIKNTGNDLNTGLSDAQAWSSMQKVNAATYGTFHAGDSILFNRGDTWRWQLWVDDCGTSDAWLYYGAYGTGAKPKIFNSVQANSTGDWTEVSTNLWQNSNASFTDDVGNLVFNNEASCGIKIMSATPTFTTQGQFWYDYVNHRIRLYSVGNPATFYTNIECVLSGYAMFAQNVQYVTIENFDCRYVYFGIMIQGYDNPENVAHHIILRDCDFSFVGGGDWLKNYAVRQGDAISINDNAHDIWVERCHVSQGYDAGLTNQASSYNHTQYNIYFINNLVEKCDFAIAPMIRSAGSSMNNIYYEGNTVVNSGEGWGHNQRPDGPYGCAMRVFDCIDFGGTASNMYIRNNIFYKGTGALINFSATADLAAYTFDNNILYNPTGNVGELETVGYTTIAQWRTASGKDAHSISSDPIFISTSDFHLQGTSPAIGKGYSVASLTDFDNNKRRGYFDIGAYEYQSDIGAVAYSKKIVLYHKKAIIW